MTRSALPDRRPQETFDLVHGNGRYAVSFGFAKDGTIGEVFVQTRKAASDLEAAARDSAILISFMVQHGLPIHDLRNGLTRDQQGAPSSIIGAVLDAMGGAA